MLKNFKDYMLNEADFKNAPNSERIYKAIIKEFNRYYKANVGKLRAFNINNPAKFIEDSVTNNKDYFKDYEIEALDFIRACQKYIQMASWCYNVSPELETNGTNKTWIDVWDSFRFANAKPSSTSKLKTSQAKDIFNNLKKELDIY